MKLYKSLLLLFLGFNFLFSQFSIPEKPALKDQKPIYDYVNVLDESKENLLSTKLKNYEDSTGTQIVLITIKSTNGENISQLGAKWGEKWGIGQEKEDNGIVILLAKEDRNIDINTGYGVFYYLSNRDVEKIINGVILPRFKQGDYYSGLDQGTNALILALNGKFNEDNKDGKNVLPTALFILIIILILFIISSKGGGSGGMRRRGMTDDTVIFTNMGRWGNTSGGFGGGSFGSGGGGFSGGFGGGSFGGGGASGSW